MLKRVVVFAYGVASYGVFFATFLYSVGFIGNLVVPKTMDSPSRDAVSVRTGHRRAAAGNLRRATQCDGAAVVQAGVDASCSGAGRAQHLRPFLQPGIDRIVRLLAAAGRNGVEHPESDWPDGRCTSCSGWGSDWC